jgi:hypothetical protein
LFVVTAEGTAHGSGTFPLDVGVPLVSHR